MSLVVEFYDDNRGSKVMRKDLIVCTFLAVVACRSGLGLIIAPFRSFFKIRMRMRRVVLAFKRKYSRHLQVCEYS